MLFEEFGELLLEVLGVVAHLLVELVGVFLDHLFELFVVLLHFGGEGGFVGLVGEELLVLFFHLLGELGVEAVELVGEFLEGGGHFFFFFKFCVSFLLKETLDTFFVLFCFNNVREFMMIKSEMIIFLEEFSKTIHKK